MHTIALSHINYRYVQNSGRVAARHLTCATAEVQKHIDRLRADPRASAIKLVN